MIRPDCVVHSNMLLVKFAKTLNIKELLSFLGALCLIAGVCEFVFLTRIKEISRYHLSERYRNVQMVFHNYEQFSNITESTYRNISENRFSESINNLTNDQNVTFSGRNFSFQNIPRKGIKDVILPDSKHAMKLKHSQESETEGNNNAKNGEYVRLNTSTTNISSSGQESSARPDNCSNCFNHDFHFTLDNENICATGTGNEAQKVDILIIIFTTHTRKEQRDAIRQTWITHARNNTGNVRYVFLLGNSNETELNRAVIEENTIYSDLLQENCTDAYLNLTYKTLMGFKWALTHCNKTRFVFKTDDDMYVNVPMLVNITLSHAQQLQTAVGGNCHLNNQRPIRDKLSKWYASNASYPQELYPGFCSGTGYITSIDVVRKIYQISKNVPFFHLEDIYISLCIKQLGYQLLPLYGFHNNRVRIDYCSYKSGLVVTSHELSPALLKDVWKGVCYRASFLRFFALFFAFIFVVSVCLCAAACSWES